MRFFCLLLAFFVAGCDTPLERVDEPLPAWLDARIPGWLQQLEVPGAAVAVMEDGEITLLGAYGFANTKDRVNMTADHLFNVASISKAVTAWGVMRLIEGGDIDPDQPVNLYLNRWQLPDGAGTADEVTVRRLLSHTAGISMPSTPGFRWPMDMPDLVSVLSGDYEDSTYARSGTKAEIAYRPGDAFHYSGGGYLILQLLVEDVTELSFQEYMQEAVLAPLGMKDSRYGWDRQLHERMATPYRASGNVEDIFRLPGLAASSLHASARDLAKWMLAAARINVELRNRVISEASFESMLIPVADVTDGEGDFESMGLGYFLQRSGEMVVAGHAGGNAGWRARFLVSPVEGDGILVLTNSTDGDELIELLSCAWAQTQKSLDGFGECQVGAGGN